MDKSNPQQAIVPEAPDDPDDETSISFIIGNICGQLHAIETQLRALSGVWNMSRRPPRITGICPQPDEEGGDENPPSRLVRYSRMPITPIPFPNEADAGSVPASESDGGNTS